jgi:hypothetical protein
MMPEPSIKQFEVAVDIAKQLITVSAAIITVTIAFSRDFVGIARMSGLDKVLAGSAWVLLLLSVVGGLWCLYAVNGTIEAVTRSSPEAKSIYDWNIAIPMGIQQVTFLLAIVVTVVFGVRTI